MTMKTSITSQKRMTDGQVAKVKELTEAALRKSELDKQGVQRVIEQGDELQNQLIPIFKNLGELPYADEEIRSNYGYPDGWRLKLVEAVLEKLTDPSFPFRHCNPDPVYKWLKGDDSAIPNGQKLRVLASQNPVDEEGIVDRWGRPFRLYDGVGIFPKITSAVEAEPTQLVQAYSPATELMTELMKKHRDDWYNYEEGCLGPRHLHLIDKTYEVYAKREIETPGGFLVIPIQLGLRHRGRSVRRARVMFGENEFGLGPYEVGIILLVHPERLQQYEHLSIDCAGCEYSPDAGGEFSHHLSFNWHDGELKFGFNFWIDYARQHYGSASGFLG
jgi:hypothetical protein